VGSVELLVFIVLFVLLDIVALRFGADSRDDVANWP
jgi:hypothetical protein